MSTAGSRSGGGVTGGRGVRTEGAAADAADSSSCVKSIAAVLCTEESGGVEALVERERSCMGCCDASSGCVASLAAAGAAVAFARALAGVEVARVDRRRYWAMSASPETAAAAEVWSNPEAAAAVDAPAARTGRTVANCSSVSLSRRGGARRGSSMSLAPRATSNSVPRLCSLVTCK